ncbi:hypothetical protein F4604DRAFT_1677435 [Suillus subluteus]|nr:hypothetical protein F4604DRAFT_1677435 [Suillus subluteus]
MDFWEDVLQVEANEIAQKLEQWACMIGTIAQRCDIRINYANFNTMIKEKLLIYIKGWPEGIAFQSPTSVNDLHALLKLQGALKDGSCHWFCMTPHQCDEFHALLDARCKRGEKVGKPRKKCADARMPHKWKGKENAPPRKWVQAPGSSAQAPKSTKFIDLSKEEEESSEDEV